MKAYLDIEVDGGTIKLINDARANMFVSGSFILKSNDVNEAIDSLRKLVQ